MESETTATATDSTTSEATSEISSQTSSSQTSQTTESSSVSETSSEVTSTSTLELTTEQVSTTTVSEISSSSSTSSTATATPTCQSFTIRADTVAALGVASTNLGNAIEDIDANIIFSTTSTGQIYDINGTVISGTDTWFSSMNAASFIQHYSSGDSSVQCPRVEANGALACSNGLASTLQVCPQLVGAKAQYLFLGTGLNTELGCTQVDLTATCADSTSSAPASAPVNVGLR
ncbi:unnamed protein product [Zymoseptoria tritici ST99CH_3D7]|uniref:Uncharacterized protein n=2 Tax=Zymoseptoria tritici TaxID=1047171 RepID=A0A1X7S804_ZYMT9|nr:unnamed protein product [Zymoseptoria tritici ST99CH_3D7]